MSVDGQNGNLIGVKGWLLLLCIIFAIISPVVTVDYTLGSLFRSNGEYSILYVTTGYILSNFLSGKVNGLFFYVALFLDIVLMILSIRAGIALWAVKPKAVATAKNYLFIYLGYSVIAAILLLFAGLSNLPYFPYPVTITIAVAYFMRAIIFFAVCFSYLTYSKRVAATYGLTPKAPETEINIDQNSKTYK
ncbi:MAG: hypothetical protein FWD70_04080 [Desulfuromonadales bacterium]|nr:hypothetical protein [Desulfuromonadales bacterium]